MGGEEFFAFSEEVPGFFVLVGAGNVEEGIVRTTTTRISHLTKMQ